jgi:hypothetical protein
MLCWSGAINVEANVIPEMGSRAEFKATVMKMRLIGYGCAPCNFDWTVDVEGMGPYCDKCKRLATPVLYWSDHMYLEEETDLHAGLVMLIRYSR